MSGEKWGRETEEYRCWGNEKRVFGVKWNNEGDPKRTSKWGRKKGRCKREKDYEKKEEIRVRKRKRKEGNERK